MVSENYTEKVSVNINSSTLSTIDLLVDNGYYSNRSDFINQALRESLLRQQTTVDRIVEKFKANGIPFGIGGIARLGKGILPAEYILAEHIRLGSGAVILSRSFCNDILFSDRPDREVVFTREVRRMKEAETELRRNPPEFFRENHLQLRRIVDGILEGMA